MEVEELKELEKTDEAPEDNPELEGERRTVRL
jgi:hypothetical protein